MILGEVWVIEGYFVGLCLAGLGMACLLMRVWIWDVVVGLRERLWWCLLEDSEKERRKRMWLLRKERPVRAVYLDTYIDGTERAEKVRILLFRCRNMEIPEVQKGVTRISESLKKQCEPLKRKDEESFDGMDAAHTFLKEEHPELWLIRENITWMGAMRDEGTREWIRSSGLSHHEIATIKRSGTESIPLVLFGRTFREIGRKNTRYSILMIIATSFLAFAGVVQAWKLVVNG